MNRLSRKLALYSVVFILILQSCNLHNESDNDEIQVNMQSLLPPYFQYQYDMEIIVPALYHESEISLDKKIATSYSNILEKQTMAVQAGKRFVQILMSSNF